MFLGKDEHGDFILDPNEPRPTAAELERAQQDYARWTDAKRKHGDAKAGLCPHESDPCEQPGGRRCLNRLVWWRRYIKEIYA